MLTKPKDCDIFLPKFNQIKEITFSKIEKTKKMKIYLGKKVESIIQIK